MRACVRACVHACVRVFFIADLPSILSRYARAYRGSLRLRECAICVQERRRCWAPLILVDGSREQLCVNGCCDGSFRPTYNCCKLTLCFPLTVQFHRRRSNNNSARPRRENDAPETSWERFNEDINYADIFMYNTHMCIHRTNCFAKKLEAAK